jgi:hypothetical protein
MVCSILLKAYSIRINTPTLILPLDRGRISWDSRVWFQYLISRKIATVIEIDIIAKRGIIAIRHMRYAVA